LLGLRELILDLCELLLSGLQRLLQNGKLGLSLLAGLIELSQFALSGRGPALKIRDSSCCAPLLVELRSCGDLSLLQAGRFCAGCSEPARVRQPHAEGHKPAQDGSASQHQRKRPSQLGAVIDWHDWIPEQW
jgi:hypothetical protein